MIFNAKDLPPLEFVTRSKSGIAFYSMKEGESKPTKTDFFPSTCCEEVVWSKDGSLCLYRETNGVRVFDMEKHEERFSLPLPKVVAIGVSPLNNWLVTLTPFKTEPNLQIWDCKTGALHFSLVQKSFSRSCWPYLQWDCQENHALFHSGDYITLFNGHDLNDDSAKQEIRSGNITQNGQFVIQSNSMVRLSPSATNPAILVFTPTKESEGYIGYYADKSKEEGNHFSLVHRLRCMNCNQGECEWNCSGTRAIIKVSSDVDRTGVSYYGSTKLYYLFNDDKLRSDILLNIMRGELSVQEAHFSHDGSRLCAITTSVPASSVMYSTKECNEEGSCGKYNVNTILWSPHGRLLCLAGFGNLSGEVHIWDCIERKQLLQFKTDYITSCSWTNDSRYMVMGTCYPRMKIDNRLYLYKYNGKKLYEENVDLLYEIAVRPVPDGIYPMRPPTQEELAEIRTVNQTKAPAKYVPPHLRNKTGGSVPGMSRSPNRRNVVPGMKAPSKPKQNKQPRTTNSPVEQIQGPNLMDAIFASVEQPSETVETIQKKIRNLNKKLREIEQIKAKWDVMNEEQLLKISKEESLNAEIRELEKKLQSMK